MTTYFGQKKKIGHYLPFDCSMPSLGKIFTDFLLLALSDFGSRRQTEIFTKELERFVLFCFVLFCFVLFCFVFVFFWGGGGGGGGGRGNEPEPMLTPREITPLPEAQRRVEPVTLRHAGQPVQHTTH